MDGDGSARTTVASFGSINVDRVAYVDSDTVVDLSARYDWFPGPGETVGVDARRIPGDFDDYVDDRFLGGKGANQAVAAAAAGAKSTLLGAVGTDAATVGAGVRRRLRDREVDVDGVAVVDAPTGTAYVFVTPDGENHIATITGANGTVDAAYARRSRVRERALGADYLLLQNEVPTRAALTLLNELSGLPDRPTVVLDPAPAAGAADVLSHPAVDVATPNDPEYRTLSDGFERFEGTVVCTHGAAGVTVSTPAGGKDGDEDGHGRGQECENFEVPTPAVEAIDTTGAGDVFNGYLATRLAVGDSLRRAVEVAATAAALSTTREGVQRATPDADAVRALLDDDAVILDDTTGD
jgi:ribokinase